MATSNNHDKIFQCSKCKNGLNMDSKTLTCLHSLCSRCLDEEFQGETTGNGHCPQCQELVQIDQLTLLPFLAYSLKRRQHLELTEWKCDVCLEEGDESLATIWCNDCNRFFCDKCNRVHKRLVINHNSIELGGKEKDEVLKAMRTDLCNIHKKVEDSYCDRCNVCLCDTCYKTHLNQSPQCPSHPISVSEEAVKKRTSQGPTFLREIEELKNNLEEITRKSRIYSEGLERDCDLKCEELWRNYEDILDELRDKTHKMCEELRIITNEQVKKWQKLVEENERLLKKLEIWRLNLCHFLGKDDKYKNEMICGVEMIGSKLASSSVPHPNQIFTEPMRKCELNLKFSHFWLQFIEGLKNEMIASGSLIYSDTLIQFENEWNLPESNTSRNILSILVSQKDSHIFLGDVEDKSIIELTEVGNFISECILIDNRTKFSPREMFFTSSEILGVKCWDGREEKLFFLERKTISPFLKIKTIIDTRQNFPFSFSVCKMKKTILICDGEKFQIDFYTENGEYIKTIDTGELGGKSNSVRLIRANPLTGNFWGATAATCKIFCFDKNGQKLESFETQKEIWNFSINKFGNLYFCDLEGIFSFLPEKVLHTFPKKSEAYPSIFVSREKIFVCLQIDGKCLIKIFKILN